MSSERRVLLTRTPFGQGERFKVTASEGFLMPNELFRMMLRPIDPDNPSTTITVFLGICTPVELQTLPINGPFDNDDKFRVNEIDLTFASFAAAESAWEAIVEAVEGLKADLDSLDVVGEPLETWVGTPPP